MIWVSMPIFRSIFRWKGGKKLLCIILHFSLLVNGFGKVCVRQFVLPDGLEKIFLKNPKMAFRHNCGILVFMLFLALADMQKQTYHNATFPTYCKHLSVIEFVNNLRKNAIYALYSPIFPWYTLFFYQTNPLENSCCTCWQQGIWPKLRHFFVNKLVNEFVTKFFLVTLL